MVRYLLAGTLALGTLAATVARADDSIGKRIFEEGSASGAPACAACHGADGAGSPDGQFPAIAGLDAHYLAKQIADFRSGHRVNETMEPIAQALTDAEVGAVTAHVAALPAPAAEGAGSKEGDAIATIGRWAVGVPACEACHGRNGIGSGAAFPALAGQKADYIVAQFAAWRAGTRHNDPLGLMKAVADRLSEADVAAVAAHFQAARR